jgi:hypothetical protein
MWFYFLLIVVALSLIFYLLFLEVMVEWSILPYILECILSEFTYLGLEPLEYELIYELMYVFMVHEH